MRAYGICACFPKQAYALLCSNYCPHEYFRPYKIIHVFLVLILTVQVLISFSPQPHIIGWPQKFGIMRACSSCIALNGTGIFLLVTKCRMCTAGFQSYLVKHNCDKKVPLLHQLKENNFASEGVNASNRYIC